MINWWYLRLAGSRHNNDRQVPSASISRRRAIAAMATARCGECTHILPLSAF